MPNRPDVHLSCSLTSDGESYSVVEDQPEEQWLTNPRNLKRARFTFPHWGFRIVDIEQNAASSQTRYLRADTTYEQIEIIGQGFEFDFEEAYSMSSEINTWTGEWTPIDATAREGPFLFLSTGIPESSSETTFVTIFTTDDNEGNKTIYRLTTTLSNPIHITDISSRAISRALWFSEQSSPGGFHAIQDGYSANVTFSDEDGSEIEETNLHSQEPESDRYSVFLQYIHNETPPPSPTGGSTFYSGGFVTISIDAVQTIPLGGFCIWEKRTDEPAHLISQYIPSQSFQDIDKINEAYHKELFRGSYAGHNCDKLARPNPTFSILIPPDFPNGTLFGPDNGLGRFVTLTMWRQIRFFEDIPHVGNVQTAWVIQNEVHIHGLWLPPINVYGGVLPDFWINESSNIELVHIPTGELFDKTRFVFCDAYRKIARGPDDRYERVGPELGNVVKNNVHKGDTYADLISITGVLQNPYKRKLPGGWYHLKITSDLGYWDSREYPDKYPNGLFNMQDPFGT